MLLFYNLIKISLVFMVGVLEIFFKKHEWNVVKTSKKIKNSVGNRLSSSAECTAVDEKPSKEYWVYHFAFCLLLPSFTTVYSYNVYPFIYLLTQSF